MDIDRLRQRLTEMTPQQLRGRWKRIEDRLHGPLHTLGRVFLEQNKVFETRGLAGEDALRARFVDIVKDWDVFDDEAAIPEEVALSFKALGSRVAFLILEEDREEAMDESPAFAAVLEARGETLTRARELMQQRALVAEVLRSRGEEVNMDLAPAPRPAPPRLVVEKAPTTAVAPKAPVIVREVPEDRGGDLVARVGEVGKGLGSKIADSAKRAAGSASKAAGKGLWAATKSAFGYGGPKAPPRPEVSPLRRRRRRGASDADESILLIEKLHQLHERGILSEDEFNAKKADLLDRI